jgi:hypothetical protein
MLDISKKKEAALIGDSLWLSMKVFYCLIIFSWKSADPLFILIK